MENEIDFLKKIIVEHYQLKRQMVQMEILLVLTWVQTDLGSSCYQLRLAIDKARKVLIRLLCHVCISYI